MKTLRPLFPTCLILLFIASFTAKADAACAKTIRFAPVTPCNDTIQIFLFQQLCAGDLFQGHTWQTDTVTSVFLPGTNGTDTLKFIEIDVIPAPAFDLAGDSLLCTGETGMLQVPGFFSAFQWSNGSNKGVIQIATPGLYSVTVTASNGCTGEKETAVIVLMPDFSLDFQSPLCAASADGTIWINNFFGGISPYEVSLDGSAFQSDTFFSNLPAGDYQLTLRDAAGCTNSMTLALAAPPPFGVDIGPDVFLLPGDTLRLSATATDSVASWNWSPPGLFDCAVCPMPLVLHPATTAVALTVTNSKGCTATDELNLVYDSQFRLYVPNVFSPNSDGENDFFEVFPGKGNWEVAEFMVFDRWGGLVFQSDVPCRYPETLAWDGSSRGKQLLPGVYIWAARLRFADGSEETREGDVTLVR
ncbi:MAG TPA: gliding motility-associated C-terminal domain-containing protein [Saprospiraceae bacterium]|nr:gliding motility-associated C-terminal domain-containing protein [Saprospiraceae bacterium]